MGSAHGIHPVFFLASDLDEILVCSINHPLNSRIQKMPDFDSVDGRNAMPSGLSRKNLVWVVASLFRSSRSNFDSACVRGWFISRSLDVFHIFFFVNEWYSL